MYTLPYTSHSTHYFFATKNQPLYPPQLRGGLVISQLTKLSCGLITHLNCTRHKDGTFMLETLYKHCVVFIVQINLLHCIISFLLKDVPTAFSPLGWLCPHKEKKKEPRKLGNIRKLSKPYGMIAQCPVSLPK